MRTVTEIQEELALHVAARNKILEGSQSWSVGENQYTYASLPALDRIIRELRDELWFTQNASSSSQPVIFGGRR